MANKVEPVITLKRVKIDDSEGRPARATQKSGKRALLGDSSLYAEIHNGQRLIFFHQIGNVEITSNHGKVKKRELQSDPSWKTITLRRREELQFIIPQHVATNTRNRVKVIFAS